MATTKEAIQPDSSTQLRSKALSYFLPETKEEPRLSPEEQEIVDYLQEVVPEPPSLPENTPTSQITPPQKRKPENHSIHKNLFEPNL